MKSILGVGKATPSLLALSVIGLWAASLSPAQATSEPNPISVTAASLSVEGAQLAANPEFSLEASTVDAQTDSQHSAASLQAAALNVDSVDSAESADLAIAPVSTSADQTGIGTNSSNTSLIDPTAAALSIEASQTEEAPSASILPVAETRLENSMSQVTSVTQLSDVQPTDWAYQALQSLVERYGCIAGYPDGTFRGNRALTRYEFAAGLNACLDRVNELIALSLSESVTREDLGTLQRLQEEFAAELATLRGRVDALEARTAELEANQFSTTTKLFGQAVIGVQGRNENDFQFFQDTLTDTNSNINLITNVQLSLYTQFSPSSLLLTGLQAGDGNTAGSPPTLTNFVGLSYEGDTDNSWQLSDLSYRQLFGNNLAVILGPQGVNAVNVFRGANRVEGAGFGPLSRFAQRNPIISIGSGRGGVGVDWQVASRLSLQGIYSASNPGDPNQGGLFGGENGVTTVGAQLVATPVDNLDISLQYLNSYSPFGQLQTGIGDDLLATADPLTGRAPMQTNAVGATLEWGITPNITAGGWVGYTHSDLRGISGSVETINWMAFLNFPDLFGEGNMGGIYVGQPPKITNSSLPASRNIPSLVNRADPFAAEGGQPSTTTHVEAFYRFRVTDNISLTPGVIVIFNPNHNANNDTITIGALRTTLTF